MRRFIIDNQLPATLVVWLEAKGCQAEHVLKLHLAQSPDEILWERAARDGAVIVSKDEDFAHLTIVRPEAVSVLWIRLGNCRTPVLLAAMERAWPTIEEQLDAGARLIEVL